MSREFDFYPLEDRILLSGDGLDGLGGAMDIDFDLEAALLSQLSDADGEVAGDGATAAPQPLTHDQDVSDIATDDVAEAVVLDPAQPIEVIFVDAGVEDAETLIEGLRANTDGQTQWLVIRLQAEQDGLLQITETLRNLSSVDAVHLLSHGDGRGIQLGNTRLDLDAAPNYAGEIASWGHALDNDADLLIYGCDLASTESGRDLIDILAVVCDCDVAASDDVTGHASRGGDWDLEYTVGDVDLAHVLAPREWFGMLSTETAESGSPSQSDSAGIALAFEENVGQSDDAVDFLSRGDGYTVFLTDGDAVLNLNGSVFTIDIVSNQSPTAVVGVDELTGRSNYLVGAQDAWIRDVANFAAVQYDDIYDGIDVRYYGHGQQLEYDFIVAAGANTDQITLIMQGAESVSISDSGELVMVLAGSEQMIRFRAPYSYQLSSSGVREVVESRYQIRDDGSIGFELGDYDQSRELVIDPIMDYGSYLGGLSGESANAIQVDADGNAYITGGTVSTDFPTTTGPFGTTGGDDMFVTKMSADGSTVLYTTYLGGSGNDIAYDIDIDSSGNAYVVGKTTSSDFTTTTGAYDETLSGASDGFVLKLDSTGSSILYGSYIGSNLSNDSAYGVAVNAAGQAYVTGVATGSIASLTSAGSYQSTFGGGRDAFLAVFSIDGSSIDYGSYFGGSGAEEATDIAIDDSGAAYITGVTNSSDMPVTGNAFQSTNGGGQDVFIAKINPLGGGVSDLTYSSYLGGSMAEQASAIALDSSGRAYVVGLTISSDFDVTAGAYDTSISGGNDDAFLSVFDTTLSGAASLAYSTSLGGTATDEAAGVAVDSSGVAWIVGTTYSTTFPTTADAHDTSKGGTTDAFITAINPLGGGASDLVYSTFLGGSANEFGYAIALDAADNIYVAGQTQSSDFDATSGAYDESMGGASDAFVAKFSQTPDAYLWLNTENDVTGSGVAGLDSWTGGTVLQLGDPNLGFSSSTSGTLTSVFNIDDLVDDGDARLSGIHYVGRDLLVGSNNIQLYAGDVLFSTVTDEWINGGSEQIFAHDILLFRPVTVGNYATGTLSLLFDGSDVIGNLDVNAFTLVEETTTVGTTTPMTLNAGDFLISHAGFTNRVYRYEPGTLGATSSGTTSIFLDGTDFGVDTGFRGIDLVERSVKVGDTTLTSGQLLATLHSDDNAIGGIATTRDDIFLIDVTATGATTAATASVFFQGDDIGLNTATWQEQPWGLSLASTTAVSTITVDAATTGDGGLSINDDGGDDVYLVADDGGAIIGGRTSITIEVQYSSTDSNGAQPLFAYASPSTDNELLLYIDGAGNLGLYLNGALATSTAIDYRTLSNGDMQSLAMTWDNAAGNWQVFVNGILIDRGSGLNTGQTFDAGGTLQFGQEQDGNGTNFDTSQTFHGTFYNVRVFDDVRTGAEIAATYKSSLPHDESGLLAQWDFDRLSANGVITESVSGNNLTVNHTAESGFTTSTPKLTFLLDEHADTGTVVGSVFATNAERDAKIASLLAADPDLVYSAETGKFYKTISTAQTWVNSQSAAIASSLSGVSGELVTIRSAAENELITEFRNTAGADLWIGASDQTIEGLWQWQSGASDNDLFWLGGSTGSRQNGAYTNWIANEPNATTADDDFARINSTGEWGDRDSTYSYGYVVQWDADDVLDQTSELTYSIAAQSIDGTFAIDADNGQITVSDSTLLDTETDATHSITVRVTAASGHSYDKTFDVQVRNNSGEAEQSVPGTQLLAEDYPLTFSAGTGNAITVSDGGPSNNRLQVSLSVTDGILTLSQTTGLTILSGANGSATMVIQGSESDLNAALEGMVFQPDAQFSGAVDLQMTTSLIADLAGHYNFDDGDARDDSAGTSHDGVMQADATTVVDPDRGTVLSLDGTGDGVDIVGTMGSSPNATLAAWVNLDVKGSQGSEVISVADSLVLRLDENSNGVSGVYYDGSSWVSIGSGRFIAGTGWHHVAFSFDDTNNVQTLYIDGQRVAMTQSTASIVYDDFSKTTIGHHANGSAIYDFDGLIDDARIYNRALSADEIANLASDNARAVDSITIDVVPLNDAPVFGSDGDGSTTLPIPGSLFDLGFSSVVQTDGKIVMVGSSYFADNDITVVRFHTNGELDLTFGGGDGIATLDAGGSELAVDVALQSDGKIVVFGSSDNDLLVARFTVAGVLDATFDSDGYAITDVNGIDSASEIAIQSDGKIVVAGNTDAGGNNFSVVRYNTDGSLDTTFSGDGKVEIDFGASSDDVANSVLIQSDGKIVVAGKSNNQFALARLTSSGLMDTSFDSDGLLTTDFGVGDETVSGLAQQSDGKIIAVGTANLDFALARYNTDGSLDNTFDVDGLQTSDLGATERAYSVALTATGKIVVSGVTDLMGSNDVMLQRYNADGSLDTSFNTVGTVITVVDATQEYAYNVQVLSNGSISVAGNMQNTGFLLNQYNEDGSLDTNFAPTANLVDANPTYVEGSAPIVLDSSVSVFDQELSDQNNFSGSTIALLRRVGVNGEDVFGFSDGNGLSVSAGSLYKNGQVIATFNITTPGLVVVTFTDANGETPTQTDVNNVYRQMTYANSSDTPPASVELLWYFVDGNAGGQGFGSSFFVTDVMTVNITATNDDPTNAGSLPSDITVTEGVSSNVDLSQIDLSDADHGGGDLTLTLTTSTGGNLSASSGGGVTIGGSGTGTLSLTGTLADLNTYLDTASNIEYLHSTPDQAGDNADTITVVVNDNGNTGTGGGSDVNLGSVNVDITNVNDAPVITSDGGGDTANINVDENTTAVTIVTATDADLPSQTLTYSIFGGADAAKFNINSADGTLIFVAAPDFESPADVGGDNVYDVIVRVSDGTLTDDQAIAVTVVDVSNVLVVTTATDNNDSGILVGASYDIEWLNANKGTDGEISLREAIIAANNTAGMDTVSFNIAGAGVHTIGLLSVLPSITEAITIDGYTQSGSSINTATNGSNAVLQIELDGTNTGAGASGLKLIAGSDGSTIRGLAINRFSGSGVEINNSDNNTIVGNFLGTSVDGTSGQSNVYGVNVTNGANNNTIGGSAAGDRNVISGNTTAGVFISSSDNIVAGNVVGLNAAGTAAIANTRGVYLLNAANTLIGGTTAGAGNVISGNSIDGVLVTGATSAGTRIEGNYIGTNAAGDAGIANLIKGVGLTTNATGVTVGGSAAGAGNVISGNSNTGVYIASGGNLVTGNFVGLNAAGTAAVANGTGVYIYHAANNTIGGTSASERNVISGNTSNGVYISGSGSTGNIVQGNYIGTNAAGDAAVANTATGVSIAASATNNTIGGSVTGTGNVISGNSTYGVYVNASNNTVAGNTIGLNAAGTAAIANNYGIHLLNAANNVIGGTTTEARNVISGNTVDGVYISGATSTGNSIQGNFIGTNAAGTSAISNGRFGISLINNASANTIGGAVSGAGNVISGNVSSGVYVSASNNTLVGNTVGLNATGTAAIANYSGIYINNVSGTTIGGTTALARNVISGNTSDGVFITGASATGNVVQGNYIGTNTAGTSGIANINAGINIQSNASGNTIGGAVAGAGNVISGNQSMGVYVAAPNNTLSGNIVGLNAAGDAKVANAGFGIYVTSAGVGTSIGGTTSLQRNVVSGNGADGIVVDGGGSSSAMNVMIQGNYVGTNLAGTSGLSNSRHGVYFYNAAATNTLGGTVSGAGNVISGNASYGVLVEGTSNLVAGNTIGLDAAGTAAIANSTGVYINNVGSTTIGGTTALARNVISGNTNDGIYITGVSATGNLVQGNYIGTNAAGTAAVGNGNAGINITSSAAGNTIGGTDAGAGNLISGNANYGVYTAASNTTIQGNFIGTDASGTGAIANGADNSATGGIYIAGGSGSTIGGTSTSARNVISGNGGAGIWINAGGDTTTIQGNYIGVDVTGDTALGNGRWGVVNQSGDNVQIGGIAAGAGNVISGSTNSSGGVFIGPTADGTVIEGNRIGIGGTTTSALSSVQVVGIWLASGSSNTRIGGTTAPAGNIIAGNGVSGGIKVVGTSTGNTIQRNSIYGNLGIGIDLNDDGTTTNDGAKTGGAANLLMDSPVVGIANLVSNDLLLTGYVGSAANQATFANSRVEFFISDESSAYGSGQTYLGFLTTDASGNFSGTLDVTGFSLTQSSSITATATDSSGNTSEFGVNFAVNVAPTAVTDNLTAVEAGGVGNATAGTNPTGNVLSNDTDPDSGDTQTVIGVAAGTVGSASGNVGSNVTGSFGTLQIDSNGAYVYTVDNSNAAVQALRNSGDTLTDVFTYTMNDSGGMESTTQVTITIEGANDAPEAADLTKTINEDTPLTLAAADFGFTDVDSSDSMIAVRIDVLPAAGTLNLTGSGPVTAAQVITIADINAGKLVFTPAANDNGAGYASIAFSVADASNTFDGSPNTITIDVTAVNDAPELDNSETFTLTGITEDQTNNSGDTVASIIASLSGNRISDVDASPSEGIAIQSISGGNGTWQYSLDGSTWTDVGTVNTTTSLLLRSSDYLRYVPDAMNADTSSLSFVAWDQTTGTEGTKVSTATTGGTTAFSDNVGLAEVTVTAVNDAPTITDSATVTLSGTNEDTPSTPTSVDSIVSSAGWADVDTGAVKGIAVTGLTGNGTWQYSTDGSNWTSFSGISGSTALLLNASTQIRYQPDSLNGETATFDFVAWDTTTGSASSFGSPSYADPDSGGGTTAYSSETATASIVVTDVNDAVVAVADTDTATEAGGVANATAGTNPSGNVLSNDVEYDTGDTLNVTGVAAGTVASAAGNVGTSVTGTYGNISIASNGAYTYTVDNNNAIVQALRTSGTTITDTFTYTVQDSGGSFSSTQIVITIEGQNDAPVAVTDNVVAIEAGGDNNASAGTDPTGNVLTNDTDVDSGDTKTVTGVVVGTAGSASGNVASALAGSYGSITINANGSYIYNVDNNNAAVQALRTSSNTLQDVFTYTMQDTDGSSSTTQVTVTIQGQNDDPVAVDDNAAAVEAGGTSNGTAGINPSGNVLSNDTDVDSGDTKTVVGVAAGSQSVASGSVATGVNGSYGSIQIAGDGSYTYTVDNNNSAVQALRTSGQSLSEVFTYTIQDASGADSTAEITVTITGANDAPDAVANAATATEASGILNNISGTDPSGNVLTNDTDVDAGDTKTVTGVATGVQGSTSGNVGSTVVGTYGSLVINSNGTYTYTLDNDNAAVEALNDGDSLSETFSYTMQDTAGLASTTQLVITIDGRTDQPVAVADMDTSEEAGGVGNATPGSNPSGNVLDNDVSGNGKTIVGVAAGSTGSASGNVGTTVTGTYGTVVINSDGTYTYTLDNSKPAVEALLNSGDHVTDIFTYTMEDTFSNMSSTELTITVDGQNDAPESVNDTSIAVESGGVANGTAGSSATGNVLSNDTDVDSDDTKSVIGVQLGTVGSASGSVGASVTGNYGQIVINSDGSYTYTIDQNNAAVQALRTASDTLQEIYTYTMHDTAGLESTAQVTVTIQGANDAPVAVVDTAIAYEAGGAGNGSAGADPSGNVLTNDTDVDSGDTKTVVGVAAGVQGSASGSVGSTVTGSYGSITLNSDGSYTYNVDNDNAAVQNLRTSGESLNDVFTYTFEDTDGLSSTTQITVSVRGANDNPDVVADTAIAVEAGGTANGTAGTNPTGNVLANDSDNDAGDTIVVSGVTAGTAGSATGSVGSSVAGLFGSINIASNGSYSYTVDNSNPTVQDLLNSGDTLTDIFTYTVEDLSGATSTTQVTITIQGANDAPVATVDSAHAYEAGGIANGTAGTDPSGNVLTNDDQVDAGDTWSITGVAQGVVGSTSGSVGSSITGNFGAITINSDGSYTYNIDNDNATVQALRTASDTITDVFSYTVSDAEGLNSTAQITITLHGANDDPIAVVDTPIAVSAGGYSGGTAGTDPTGNVLTNDTDVDSGDTKTVDGVAAGVQASASGSVGSSVTGSYGSITIAANGVYTYTLDNNNAAVQALRTSSDTLTDVFTYTMIDASGSASTTQVSVTIQGANDAPVGVDDTATAVESGGVANATAGTNPTGNVLTNDTDLDSGDTKSVSGVAAGSQVSASGSVATGVSGTYGQITINSNGSYSYVVDNNNAAVQALRTSGDTLTDVFTYTMVDTAGLDSTAEITVTIQGSNDNPVATADTPTAVEAGGLANGTAGTDPTGNVLSNDTDVDAGDTKNVAGVAAGVQASASGSVGSSVAGSYGSVTINSDGSYTYVVDNSNAAVQALRTASDTLQDVFTYTVVDASGADATTQVTITIQGQNDTPTAIVDNAVAVEAGGTANGTAGTNPTGNVLTNDTDFDSVGNGETKSVSGVAAGVTGSASGSVASSVTGTYGAITINSDGSYSYVVDNSNTDVQALRNSGDTLDDVFTYTMTDAAGATSTTQITVTIQGQNDAPTALADNTIAVESGGLANGSAGTDPTGNVLANDLDPDSAANGETKTVTGVAVGVVGSASGSVAASVTGSYGAITINSDGSYSYVVDNSNVDVQALRNSGQTLDDVFTYTMTDADGLASTTQVTITIQGQNDTPTAVVDNAIAVEAGGTANGTAGTNPTGNVLTNDTDVDSVGNGETKSVSGVAAGVTGSASGSVASSVTGTYGAITINSDGSYSYVVDNSNATVQALRNSGDTLDDVFSYTMTDAAGATSTTQITVTIQGQNDAPTAVVDNAIAVEAGGMANGTAGTDATGNVLSNDTDIDSVDSQTVDGVAAGVQASASGSVGSAVTGSYGSITIAANGNFTYTVDNDNATVQALRTSSDTLTDVFTYTMIDANGAASTTQVSVTIQGANDAPTAGDDTATAVEAGGTANATAGTNPTGNVLSNDTDLDVSDTKAVSGVAAGSQVTASGSVGTSVSGAFGDITINSDGSYSYVVDNNNAAVEALRTSGDTLSDVFTYTMRDAAGLVSTAEITITIQGSNDTPYGMTTTDLTIDENLGDGQWVGAVTPRDIDTGDSFTYTLSDDAGGRFSIDSAGNIHVLDSSRLDFETDTEHNIVVRVIDQAGGQYEESFTVNLNDVDEFDVTEASDVDATANVVSENATTTTLVGLTAQATDADGTTNVVTHSLSDDAGGRFTIDSSTGVVTVAGSLDYETQTAHTITVRSQSSDGSTSYTDFTINVIDENEAPTARDDHYSVISGQTLSIAAPGVLANDSDNEGNLLQLHLVSGPQNGVLTERLDGSFVYVPSSGFFGTDTFTYVANDGFFDSNAVTVTITVTAGGGGGGNSGTDSNDGGNSGVKDSNDPGDQNENSDSSDGDTHDNDAATENGPTSPLGGPATPPPGSADNPTNENLDPSTEKNATHSLHTPAAADQLGMHANVTGQQNELRGPEFTFGGSTQMQTRHRVSTEIQMLEQLLVVDLTHAISWEQWNEGQLTKSDSTFFGIEQVGAIGAGTGIATVGYVLWALRGGVLLTTIFGSMPAWRMIDPTELLNAHRIADPKKKTGIDSFLD
ncbi:VCBS domain-containing protein [Novipirellula rosea]|uniref:Staphylococcus aureus surface protein A n=1 Tax=Novipirellula rosea TaxID=1031540 RepID=A0ABP8M3B4_9BACT